MMREGAVDKLKGEKILRAVVLEWLYTFVAFTSMNPETSHNDELIKIPLWCWQGKEKINHCEIQYNVLYNKIIHSTGRDFTTPLSHLGKRHFPDSSSLYPSCFTQGEKNKAQKYIWKSQPRDEGPLRYRYFITEST